MRNLIRRWLGLNDHEAWIAGIERRSERLEQRVDSTAALEEAVRGCARAAVDEIHRLHGPLCEVSLQLERSNSMLREKLSGISQALERDEPTVTAPLVCPQNHDGLMVMAILMRTDAVTGAQVPKGFGLYCPKCEASFYYEFGPNGGHRWSPTGSAVEVENGIPTDRPPGTVRDPAPSRRPLRFRR